jgi:hypothetical protein
VPVICVVRARGVERLEQNVVVVSIDRLIQLLRSGSAGSMGRPASLVCADASASGSVSNERIA